jgi:hypothetical protein
MSASTDSAATASNPDALDQQRRAQPAPVASPAHQPRQARGTPHRRHHNRLARRGIARRRENARPYDGHEGATPPFWPSWSCLDREGLFCSAERCYCATRDRPMDNFADDAHADHRPQPRRHAHRLHRNRQKHLNPASANHAANTSSPCFWSRARSLDASSCSSPSR